MEHVTEPPHTARDEDIVALHPPPRASARGAWTDALLIAAVTRALFFPLAWGGNWLLTSSSGSLPLGFFEVWTRWDSAILFRIAEFGYRVDPASGIPMADPHAEAFFPLFPLLVRGLHALGLPFIDAGLLVSGVASVVAFAYLWRIAEDEIGPGAGRRAIVYLALFPTGVFLIAPYTEALFLAGAIAAFSYARRGRWLLVGIPAAVAMGARFAGVFLLIGLLCEFLRQRNFSLKRAAQAGGALIVGAVPLGAYMWFLHTTGRGAFAFVEAQKEGWGRAFVGPKEAFLTTLYETSSAGYPTNWIFAWKVEIIAAFIGVAFVIIAALRREWGYAAFMGTTMAVLVTSSWYYSIPRMLLSLFPIALFAAQATHKRERAHEWALIVLAPIGTLGVIVFTRGAWFF